MAQITRLQLASLIAIAAIATGIAGYNVGYAVGSKERMVSMQATLRAYDALLRRSLENQIKANKLAVAVLTENIAITQELEERRVEDEKIRFIKGK